MVVPRHRDAVGLTVNDDSKQEAAVRGVARGELFGFRDRLQLLAERLLDVGSELVIGSVTASRHSGDRRDVHLGDETPLFHQPKDRDVVGLMKLMPASVVKEPQAPRFEAQELHFRGGFDGHLGDSGIAQQFGVGRFVGANERTGRNTNALLLAPS